MCIIGLSESGHGGRFEPCEAYKRLQEENAALRQELESSQQDHLDTIIERDALKQENQLLRAENVNLSMAHGPGNHTDWMLTRASKYEQLHKDLDALRQDLDRLAGIVEKADALAETIDHSHDLCASMAFLRERLEELRESISEPWRLQIDAYSAAVREMANRHEAVNELYECAEYTARMDMIEDAAKAYQEARHVG